MPETPESGSNWEQWEQAYLATHLALSEEVAQLRELINDETYRRSRDITHLQAAIEENTQTIASRTKRNAKNIEFLRIAAISFVAVLSLASAVDYGVFHGERLKDIIVAVCGAGGLALLGFKKIEKPGG